MNIEHHSTHCLLDSQKQETEMQLNWRHITSETNGARLNKNVFTNCVARFSAPLAVTEGLCCCPLVAN